uniref:Uncharacterized protein n=1 Tax=Oryza punctata TaxID=4537 RepID=A0A0E0MP00_ORYPU
MNLDATLRQVHPACRVESARRGGRPQAAARRLGGFGFGKTRKAKGLVGWKGLGGRDRATPRCSTRLHVTTGDGRGAAMSCRRRGRPVGQSSQANAQFSILIHHRTTIAITTLSTTLGCNAMTCDGSMSLAMTSQEPTMVGGANARGLVLVLAIYQIHEGYSSGGAPIHQGHSEVGHNVGDRAIHRTLGEHHPWLVGIVNCCQGLTEPKMKRDQKVQELGGRREHGRQPPNLCLHVEHQSHPGSQHGLVLKLPGSTRNSRLRATVAAAKRASSSRAPRDGGFSGRRLVEVQQLPGYVVVAVRHQTVKTQEASSRRPVLPLCAKLDRRPTGSSASAWREADGSERGGTEAGSGRVVADEDAARESPEEDDGKGGGLDLRRRRRRGRD